MTVSTDALLCYGIAYGEEQHPFRPSEYSQTEEDDVGVEDDELIIQKLFPDVWAHRPATWDGTPENKERWTLWWALKRDIAAKVPIEVMAYCSGDDPMYILCHKEGRYRVSRGEASRQGQTIESLPHWRDDIAEFCTKMGIEFHEPEWLLASYWG